MAEQANKDKNTATTTKPKDFPPAETVAKSPEQIEAERTAKKLRTAKAMVQQCQNACTYLKDLIGEGEMPSAEVLQACTVVSGSLANTIAE